LGTIKQKRIQNNLKQNQNENNRPNSGNVKNQTIRINNLNRIEKIKKIKNDQIEQKTVEELDLEIFKYFNKDSNNNESIISDKELTNQN